MARIQKRSTKHTHKTKDLVTRTPLKTRGELRCSGRVGSSCSTSDTDHECRLKLVKNSQQRYGNTDKEMVMD